MTSCKWHVFLLVSVSLMHYIVLDFNYFMFLSWHSLHNDIKMFHDWGRNVITIEHHGIIETIFISKWLNNQKKCPIILIYYNFPNGVTYEEGNLVFIRKLRLFSINIINLPIVDTLKVQLNVVPFATNRTYDDHGWKSF